MLTGNLTKFQNGTGFVVAENTETGLSLFQTLLLSFTLISSIALVFFLVYFVLRKRSLDELRHRLVPLYHFDPGECEDWEDELLENSKTETLRNGHKTQNVELKSNVRMKENFLQEFSRPRMDWLSRRGQPATADDVQKESNQQFDVNVINFMSSETIRGIQPAHEKALTTRDNTTQ